MVLPAQGTGCGRSSRDELQEVAAEKAAAAEGDGRLDVEGHGSVRFLIFDLGFGI
jgi:hypothetical protein